MTISGQTMGTTYNVKYLPTKNTPDKELIKVDIDQLLIEVNRQMSTYQKDSEISQFNGLPLAGQSLIISDGFVEVLSFALLVAEKTQGDFDPTIGPLVNLWGFGPEGKRKVPGIKELELARKKVGYKHLVLDREKKELKKNIPGLYLDLSASAKGHGVDQVYELLKGMGLVHFMVEIGGEVRTSGYNQKNPWRIGIERPDPNGLKRISQLILPLEEKSVATSGNYRNYFEEGGKKYSHAINYRTGEPVTHTLASVTVVSEKNCLQADSWATALMVMGPIKGLEFANRENLSAFFIFKDHNDKKGRFQLKASKKWSKMFPGSIQ